MPVETFDLVVLGAGSGGMAMASRAAEHGARVALVEPAALGGTCVNVGCVPKKAMWLAAELCHAQALAREVGFDMVPGMLDWPAFVARRECYIANIHAGYRARLERLRIEWVRAPGRFLAADRVSADGRELQAPHVLIATGARAEPPGIPGGELCIDSDGFFALRSCPRRVAVVGSGYIGVELAGVLHGLGAEVTLVARSERLLRGFDAELARELAGAVAARGLRLTFSRHTQAVRRAGEGLLLDFAEGDGAGPFDVVLWATGRPPQVAGLGLEAIGVELDGQGFVRVDEWQDTAVPGVHALGDVASPLALTPVAIAAARKLADRLFGGVAEARLDYANVPSVVFSHPPLGSVGLSEEEARARHGDAVRVYRSRFRPMLTALAGGEERTFMKLVCAGPEECVVGVHLLGTAADEMLQGFAVAVKMGARKRDFDATVAIHPTSAEELVLMR